MLQADNTDTTNQLLALSVYTQLRTAGTVISDTLNKTLTSLADAASTSFSLSVATRWINILFFLSLVFSLAAALFSILAKQWIREYIKWNSPLALPRENVLVRQVRIEAWEDWQVSVILSSIPILLELGMVLFLAGVILLLWALDDIVAKVITVFVSLFLGAFAAFTVLPIFSKRCPYRSPTARTCLWVSIGSKTLLISAFWAFVSTVISIFILVVVVARFTIKRSRGPNLSDISQAWKYCISNIRFLSPTSWRELDLKSIRITKVRTGSRWWTKAVDLHSAASWELSCEIVDLKKSGEFAAAPCDDDDIFDSVSDAAKALLLDIAETSHLIRALSWVQQSSQNTRVVDYIDQCTGEIHSNLPPPAAGKTDWCNRIRMVTNWCIFSTTTGTNPYLAMLPDSCGVGTGDRVSGITALRWRSGVYCEQSAIRFNGVVISDERHRQAAVFTRLLIHELQSNLAASRPFGSKGTSFLWRRSHEVFSILVGLHPLGFWPEIPFTLPEALLEHEVSTPHQDAVDLDVLGAVLQFVARLFATTKVQRLEHQSGLGMMKWTSQCCCSHSYIPVVSKEFTAASDYTPILLHYFQDNTLSIASDHHLNIFIVTSVRWLDHTYISSAPLTTVSSILEKMVIAAEAISYRSRRSTHGCKDAEDEKWILKLSMMDGSLSGTYGQSFRRLLHIFETSYHRDVLVGNQYWIRQILHNNLEKAHRERTCEVEDCPWNSHHCDFGNCSLLRSKEENTTAGLGAVILSPQRDGSSEPNLNDTSDLAASHEQHPQDTCALPSHTREQERSVSQPVTGKHEQEISPSSIYSPGTSIDTYSPFQGHLPATPRAGLADGIAPDAPSASHVGSIAERISYSPDRPPTADEVGPSSSHVMESSSREAGKSHVWGKAVYWRGSAVQRADTNTVLSAANAPELLQHDTAAGTGTAGARGSGSADGTLDEVHAAEAAGPDVARLPDSCKQRETFGSRPSASSTEPLLSSAFQLSAEGGGPTITTVGPGHSQRGSSQGSSTSRGVAVDEPLREGRVQDAEREGSPRRSASSLFQGVRAVSKRGSEEFELAVRDEHTGEDSGQDGQDRAESG